MESMCSSRKDECLLIDSNKKDGHDILNASHEEEPPFFLHFPSPFFGDIPATPILKNSYTHHHHLRSPSKPLNITAPSPSKSKRLKKRNANKKDRHSKIHTAQGLRDRRMRLSLHIAQKFFDLQDLLGFDKASNTIDWLFCKSNKAIKEVAESFNAQHINQSMSEDIERMDWLLSECEVGLSNKISSATNKGEKAKDVKIKNNESRMRMRSNSLAKETRDQARARARERTRERMMNKDLEKSKQLFGANPKDGIYILGLGSSASPNNHDVVEVGYTSSPFKPIGQSASSPSLQHSSTHLSLRELQLANHVEGFKNYSGNFKVASTRSSVLSNHSPPAGWLNSSDRFLGVSAEWAADNFISESYNYGIVPNTAPLTGDIYDQNPSSFSCLPAVF